MLKGKSSYCYNIFHSCNNSGNKSNKTFKPRKNIDASAASTQDLMKHAAATLGSGNLRLAVMLPEGEDINEWVAVNSKLLRLSASYDIFLDPQA